MKLQEIKEQLTKITKWPWLSDGDFIYINKSEAGLIRLIVAETQERKDAAFIASAPQTIDRLVRALELTWQEAKDAHEFIGATEETLRFFDEQVEAILSGKGET